ncbi:MAG: hypothetical protein ABIT37_16105 [Luteolibacter sp.]
MNASPWHHPVSRFSVPSFILMVLAVFLQSGIAGESALFPCPDCSKEVSRRAISCPSCGCPGAAIQEAVRADDEQKRPKRLASITADGRKGVAVFVRQDGINYLIFDAFRLAATSSLSITELGTEKAIGYSEPELMDDSPLLRFKVLGQPHATPVELSSMPVTGDHSGFLDCNDRQFATDEATVQMVAALGSQGELAAVRATAAWVPVRVGMKWTVVKPADLRSQLDLLSRARKSFEKGGLSDSEIASLREAKWLTPYLASQSAELLQTKQKPSQP